MTPVFRSSGDIIADRRYRYAQDLLDTGDPAGAEGLFAQAVEIAAHWPAGWFALGRARMATGDDAGARIAFARCAELDPDDGLGAGLHLAALGARPVQGAMSAAYVRDLFDAYAGRFDSHLAALGYDAPRLMQEALHRTGSARFTHAIDIGCGTGLMGEVLRPVSDRLIGCDLASAMVAAARAKGLYDHLEAADMVAFLDRQAAETADLVVAADVFVYAGDLAAAFAAAFRVLRTAGRFAFTTQAMPGEGWVLGEDMRHAHSRSYLESCALAAGFSLASLDEATLRQDRGRKVGGFVAVLVKT